MSDSVPVDMDNLLSVLLAHSQECGLKCESSRERLGACLDRVEEGELDPDAVRAVFTDVGGIDIAVSAAVAEGNRDREMGGEEDISPELPWTDSSED